MTHNDFVNKYNGKFIDFDGHYGYQCMDLMRQYVTEIYKVNAFSAIPASPDARRCFLNFKDNKYFKKVMNTRYAVPKKGDIIFWGYYPFVTGTAGHVAIFDGGNDLRFISFDQNYKTGTPCHYVNHSYRGVLGWLHPLK